MVEKRKQSVRRTFRAMQPRTQAYEVFTSGQKTLGWGGKKLTKTLTLDPSGLVKILWETEDKSESFSLSEVN